MLCSSSRFFLAAFGLSLVFSGSVWARSELFTYAINPIGGRVESKQAAQGPISSVGTGGDDRGTGASRAWADYGVLRTFSEAHANNTGSAFQALSAGAQAAFREDLTISAPGLDGTSGTVEVRFTIDGVLTSSGGGDSARASYASADYSFRKNDSILREESYVLYFDGTSTGDNFLGRERVITIPFSFGVAFEIQLMIESAARAYNFLGADAVSDMENTATWGGFVSVKDSSGREVSPYTVVSGSGADFTQPLLPPGARLAVRRLGNQIEVTWPASFSDYRLVTVTEIVSAQWTPVQATLTTNENRITVLLPANDSARFFKLQNP